MNKFKVAIFTILIIIFSLIGIKKLIYINQVKDIKNKEELFLNDKPIGSVLTVYDRSALAYVRLKNRDEILSTKSTKRIFVDTNPISSN